MTEYCHASGLDAATLSKYFANGETVEEAWRWFLSVHADERFYETEEFESFKKGWLSCK